eukprot:m.124252 g.124252  ORF g.124252 m.124252 type:complete len:443 (+) comp14469_c0_seq6:893-2221(+)
MGGVYNSSEDCLYLNIYAPIKYLPQAHAKTSNTKIPVMIYFPAGQFMWGSGNDAENFNAPQTAAGQEVIVVTANYRLGAAGFLALDELRSRDPNKSTGNYGMQDQRFALKWLQENIAAFGGDPNNIVLWGESAGGCAVTAHLCQPRSWPYFSKAIMESCAFNTWTYKTFHDASANALSLASHLNCTTKNSNNTIQADVNCLLNTSIDTLIDYDDDGAGYADGPLGMPYMDTIDKALWAPVIDNVEMTCAPPECAKQGKVSKVPLLFGTNRDEGSTFTYNQTGVGDSNGPHYNTMYDGFLFDYDQQEASYHPPSSPGNFTTGLFMNQSEYEVWAKNMFGEVVVDTLKSMYKPISEPSARNVSVFNEGGILNWWWSMSRTIGDFALSCPSRRVRYISPLYPLTRFLIFSNMLIFLLFLACRDLRGFMVLSMAPKCHLYFILLLN